MFSPGKTKRKTLKELGQKFEKYLINQGKLNQEGRTVENLSKLLEKYEKSWAEFDGLHNELIEDPKYDQKYISTIKNVYDKLMIVLQKQLQQATNPTNDDHNSDSDSEQSDNDHNSSDNENNHDNTEQNGTDQPIKNRRRIEFEKRYKIKFDQLVRFINNIKNTVPNMKIRMIVEMKIVKLEEKWNEYLELYTELQTLNLLDDGYDGIEEKYERTLQKLYYKLDEFDTHSNQTTISKIKVKPVELPKFNGNYENWNNFKDLFLNLISNDKTLSNVEKLQHLKTCVSGRAADSIGHLNITQDNFDVAWQILEDRFDNPRLQIAIYTDKLFDLPQIELKNIDNLILCYDTIKDCLHAIENLRINVSEADWMISRYIVRKMDSYTRTVYENSLENFKEIQTTENILQFIKTKFQILELTNQKQEKPISHKASNSKDSNNTKTFKCYLDQEFHPLYKCTKFLSLDTSERSEVCKKFKLCFNCFANNHRTIDCKSKSRCRKCNKAHNTLMHRIEVAAHLTTEEQTVTTNTEEIVQTFTTNQTESNDQTTVLATALIHLKNGDKTLEVRALIDPCSQKSYITEEVTNKLNLTKYRCPTKSSGLGANGLLSSQFKTHVTIRPRYSSSYENEINPIILKKLTHYLPNQNLIVDEMTHNKNIILADPDFNKPAKIDVILGGEIIPDLMLGGFTKEKKKNGRMMQETEFGWIVTGPIENKYNENATVHSFVVSSHDEQLQKFWQLEEVQDNKRLFTKEEERAEEIFLSTHTRDNSGRYVVKLPFKSEFIPLGKSRDIAMARLFQMERKFEKNIELKNKYVGCIDEYIQLGHMQRVYSTDENLKDSEGNFNCYYMPHHAVFKQTSNTTKLRVVFDASRKTHSGFSLNDKLCIGPTIQDDLFDIFIRWRKYKYVFTADIEKMYRQVKIDKEHQDYQRILWRDDPKKPIRDYCLTTATFGTAYASHSSIRALQQVAIDEKTKFPIGSKIVSNDFYVDNLMSGADTIDEAISNIKEVDECLKKGQFPLRQWASNDISILQNIEDRNDNFIINFDTSIKTLGLNWNRIDDCYNYDIKLKEKYEELTKRELLAAIASIFDPIGWLAPVILKGKLLLKELWKLKLDWDEIVPASIMDEWNKINEELYILKTINIPRWIPNLSKGNNIEMHGFCDASSDGYAASVYLKTSLENDVKIDLIAAKTKVAPMKTISIPRLELCAAVLLSQLINKIKKTMNLHNVPTFAHSDSEITLAWINGDPHKYNVFVANRATEIQKSNLKWNYVNTKLNPADIASRGAYPHEIKNNKLWWNGPDWLKAESINVSKNQFFTSIEMKKREIISLATFTLDNEIYSINNNLNKLMRIIAYCKRFIKNCKVKKKK